MSGEEVRPKRAKTGGKKPGSLNKRTISGAKAASKACRRKGVNTFDVMAEIALNGKDEKARLQAATKLTEYAYGKPREVVSHSGSMTVYDAVAKARARVLEFEQRPKPTAKPTTLDAEPAESPTYPEWKHENGLETPAQESAPEGEDAERGKLKRIVMQ